MYKVELQLNGEKYPIHNHIVKLKSGTVKQGINCIDSFSFEILPNNIGINKICEFKTIVKVFNTKRNIYEFQGRVLQSNPKMEETGLISKSVVCESFLGYLQDTEQNYVYERNWTPKELLTQLLTVHNGLLVDEPEKHFKVGTVFSNENIYVGIQRETTWNCIMDKIIGKIGGEIQLSFQSGEMYIDIVKERGSRKATTIELSKNMKSIVKQSDSSSYITRLIPLGAKLTDDEGNELEERIDITSVNSGKNYIEDVVGVEQFGIITKHEYWDDVNEPSILKTKATNFLAENNKVLQKYSITALDLALLGIDISYIDVCNYYPVKNRLLGIDDSLRVISKSIDIINETTTTIEIGDKFKTLSDLQVEKDNILTQLPKLEQNIKDLQTRKSVKSTTVMYYLSNSSSELVGGSWVSEPPQWVDGKFYWQKIVATFSDHTTNESEPVCITGGTGPQGEKGNDGTSVTILGSYDTIEQLKNAHPTGNVGDAYLVDGNLYVWSKTETSWKNVGNIQGPQGLQGVQGPQGLQGIQGPKGDTGSTGPKGEDGESGKTSYFHIKYSTVSKPTSSSQMTETPSTYIGTYVDFNANDSTNPNDYTWARLEGIQGEKGEQGIAGTNGTNGLTSYLHIKYSNDAGKTFTSNNGEDVGTYIGTCVDYNSNDPTTVSSYKWALIRGAKGDIGATGNGVKSITTQFYLSTSKTTQSGGSWVSAMPTWEVGKYLWTRSLITYTSGSTVYTSPICDSSWEVVNDVQKNLEDEVDEIRKEITSTIEKSEEKITSTVAEKYYAKGDVDTLVGKVSTEFSQTKDDFQMRFTNIVKDITNLDGTVNANYNELVKYIRFVGGSIVLGEVDNPLTLTLSNNRMSFLQNGIEVAYISDSRLYIYDGELLNSLKIGRWVIMIESNGSLSYAWM